jgi:hypothetical protein
MRLPVGNGAPVTDIAKVDDDRKKPSPPSLSSGSLKQNAFITSLLQSLSEV